MGSGYGLSSPVHTDWETFYADARLKAGTKLPIPLDVEERGLFIVSGSIAIGSDRFDAGQLVCLKPGKDVTVNALTDTHLMIMGGGAMDGPRYIWWNFVSSSKDRIRQAAEDWQAGAFDKVPGDDKEFIPLPDISSIDRIRA